MRAALRPTLRGRGVTGRACLAPRACARVRPRAAAGGGARVAGLSVETSQRDWDGGSGEGSGAQGEGGDGGKEEDEEASASAAAAAAAASAAAAAAASAAAAAAVGGGEGEDALDASLGIRWMHPDAVAVAPPRKRGKWTGLAVRVGAGVLLLSVGISCLAFGGWAYGLWVSTISYFCAVEFEGFITSQTLPKGLKAPPGVLRRALTATCVGINLATTAGVRQGVFESAAFVLLAALLVRRSSKSNAKKRRVRLTEMTSLVFGLFYCGYLPSFWIRLREIGAMLPTAAASSHFGSVLDAAGNVWPVGLVATLSPILCIVAADTGAYLGGKLLGATPLTSISPKKTWEGAWAGLAASCGASLLLQNFFAWPHQPVWSLGLGVGVFVASLFGDLIQSSMKREAGVKDSGSIIPGHGGILDRFDSYVFTGALVYFFWYWYFYAAKGLKLSQLFVAMGGL